MAQITLNSTGVASNGALVLQSNGTTTAVTVDTSQNVTLVGSLNINSSKNIQLNGGSGKIYFGDSTSSYYPYITSPAADVIGFNANSGTERMRIDSSGNVGIGYTSPVTKLDVFGTIRAGSGSDQGTQLNMWTGAGGDGGIAAFTIGFYTGGNNARSQRMTIDSSGGLILAGSTAQKATGTTWSNPSDQRLKDNIRDYAKGTTELMQVRVREWEYNGKGGTTEGMKGLGVIADEVMTVLPNTVENYDAKLNADDEETTAIKKFDATEITWLLVKTVQEQQAIIVTMREELDVLKAKVGA